jgi:hypothetical protein
MTQKGLSKKSAMPFGVIILMRSDDAQIMTTAKSELRLAQLACYALNLWL